MVNKRWVKVASQNQDSLLEKSHLRNVPYRAKQTGPDKVRPKDLNIAGESTKEGINIVLQRRITERKFPLKWKTTKMKVAYKKGETTDPSNYRPLSLLSVPSKILEGQICKHIDNHMEEYELHTDKQWGYRKNRSTVSDH